MAASVYIKQVKDNNVLAGARAHMLLIDALCQLAGYRQPNHAASSIATLQILARSLALLVVCDSKPGHSVICL